MSVNEREDNACLELDPKKLAFFKFQTGIEDEKELKVHIMRVQKKAYAVFAYPCIRSFRFTKLTISHLPAYKYVLELAKTRENALFLDIGCCSGQATRKLVAEGFPVQNVIGSDLRQEFWEFGHELFCSTAESFPAAFVAGDIFDDAILAASEIVYDVPSEALPAIDLTSLSSLTPIRGRLSIIYAASLFHLFKEEKQENLAHRLASLLSPEPGSVILGVQGSAPSKGIVQSSIGVGAFCHSPESWVELWDGNIFRKGSVHVECGLKELSGIAPGERWYMMWWSVARL